MTATNDIELSIVMPCLNEADTVASCVTKALRGLEKTGVRGEVIVADNGSTDGSPEIAERLGARVVRVGARGYGNALMGGIEAARGRFVVMGDADDSYDFSDLGGFVGKLREGHELVQGCRLPKGGGFVRPGAMPWLHRWIGNPLLSFLSRSWFRAPVHDVYCGLRGFTKDLYERLDLRCVGMEFATEMVIKASLHGAKIAEVPVVLHKDGRKAHRPHLRTFRDGWRTLRFLLMYSPRWLFLVPGALLIALGLLGYGVVFSGVVIGHANFDAHTLLFSMVAILSGYQAILFAAFATTFGIREHLLPESPKVMRLFDLVTLERGLAAGAVALVLGAALLLAGVNRWRLVDFGPLDYASTMRIVVPGAMLFALGFQTILSSFLLSILGMHRR
jgi:glycosyltransferase involved in cell wall biosynthesis